MMMGSSGHHSTRGLSAEEAIYFHKHGSELEKVIATHKAATQERLKAAAETQRATAEHDEALAELNKARAEFATERADHAAAVAQHQAEVAKRHADLDAKEKQLIANHEKRLADFEKRQAEVKAANKADKEDVIMGQRSLDAAKATFYAKRDQLTNNLSKMFGDLNWD